MKDELPQPSRSDLAAYNLVEPRVKLNCNRFEIPVPLKNDVNLPNNYILPPDRVSTHRKKALKQSDLGEFLSESMSELQENGYIEPPLMRWTAVKVFGICHILLHLWLKSESFTMKNQSIKVFVLMMS